MLPLSAPALAALGDPHVPAGVERAPVAAGRADHEDKYTLPVALAIFARGQFQADYGLLMAGSVVLVLPVIILFLVLQRHFTQSVAMTGIKG